MLVPGWHADHVSPFSRGGATDVANGRALCARCNLAKGNRVEQSTTDGSGIALRGWQAEAYGHYTGANRKDYLCAATPGAGKTTFGLYLAAESARAGSTKRLVVVVPTDNLRTQWMRVASSLFGIQLDDQFVNQLRGGEASDYDGVVVTYQQVAAEPSLHRALCGATETYAIFDEIHHAGEKKAWGEALRGAFEPAVKRLALTGTPFRSDDNPIPFVTYNAGGRCVTDYAYGYGEAVTDGVCREVYFPSYEGDFSWWSTSGGDRRASFRDVLPQEERARRLNTALNPDGDYLPTLLEDAHRRLMDVRENVYGDAGGLVIARDQTHAKRISTLLQQISGEPPVVAISEDPDASRKIAAFARVPHADQFLAAPPKRWIVAVKMVSEGVDIPRLFVGVYATPITTDLFFRQAVGRFVRVIPDVAGQVGYLFIPRDPSLIPLVEDIKREREHAIGERLAEEERADAERATRDRAQGAFVPGASSAAQADDVFVDGIAYSQRDVSWARELAATVGIAANDVDMARLVRLIALRQPEPTDAPRTAAPPETPSRRERKDAVKSEIKRLSSRLVGLVSSRSESSFFTHKFVHELLIQATGARQAERTEAQLDSCRVLLRGWIDAAVSAEQPLAEWAWRERARDAGQRVG